MKMQAAYALDIVKDALGEFCDGERVSALFDTASFFEMSVKRVSEIDEGRGRGNEAIRPLLCVFDNLIARGVPTRPSLLIENMLLRSACHWEDWSDDVRARRIGSIQRHFESAYREEYAAALFRALHAKGGADVGAYEALPFESDAERRFFFDILVKTLPPGLLQLVELQRPVRSIVDSPEFEKQRFDFTLELSYPFVGQRGFKVQGFIFEVDGGQHKADAQQACLDEKRDAAARAAGWVTLRVRTSAWEEDAAKLAKAMADFLQRSDYAREIQECEGIADSQEAIERSALLLTWAPVGVARIEKAIVHLALEGCLDLSKPRWDVAVCERDIACAAVAFEDFAFALDNLATLAGVTGVAPQIYLHIAHAEEGAIVLPRLGNPHVHVAFSRKNWPHLNYDLLLDNSVLHDSSAASPLDALEGDTGIAIRAAKSKGAHSPLSFAENIHYKPLGIMVENEEDRSSAFIPDEEMKRALSFFLQTIFRKTGFRPGQLQALSRALQCQDVIGLMPTGSGKSLVYQLASLLQPATALAVDPIKSLMKDQYDGLRKNGIDRCCFINSSLNRAEREAAQELIVGGEVLFAFVAPERLQIQSFRNQMQELCKDGRGFSYCVVDEAHCVSEWGHDFRTSYLRLGSNAEQFCRTVSGKRASVIALTATASYDVLADIQRELNIKDEFAIVQLPPEQMNRPELTYAVVALPDVVPKNIKSEEDIWQARAKVDKAKKQALRTLVNDERDKAGFGEHPAGLVFCPWRKQMFGVAGVAGELSNELDGIEVGQYVGSSDVMETDKLEKQKTVNQERFVNGDTELMVATKAFGMGIDKPDIRYVAHINFPSSIEGYYQEAGRAGRDKQHSDCLILFCPDECIADDTGKHTIDYGLMADFHSHSFKGEDFEKRHVFELLSDIHFPKKGRFSELEAELKDCFAAEISFNPVVSGNGRYIIYLNPDFGSIYIDDPRQPYTYYSKTDKETKRLLGEELSPDVLSVICEWLDARKAESGAVTPAQFIEFLNYGSESITEPGILTRLNDPDERDIFQVVIPLTNDREGALVELASGFVGMYQPIEGDELVRLVRDSAKFAYNWPDLLANAGKRNLVLSGQVEELHLRRVFEGMRDSSDTFKAIHRLFSIGVITDYTVDYNSDTVLATVEKHGEGYYKQQLEKFLQKYNGPQRVKEILAESYDKQKGKTELLKCLGVLIDFVYEQIASQRKAAIAAMESACRDGCDEKRYPDPKVRAAAFKESINLYMNSKYAHRDYLPADTDFGKREDFAIVEKYLDLIHEDHGGEINNLKHLRGAATALGVQYPKNYVFQLLKAFSVIALEKKQSRLFDEAKASLTAGLGRAAQSKRLENGLPDIRAALAMADVLCEHIHRCNPDADAKAEEACDEALLPLHTEWLRGFMGELSKSVPETVERG